MIIVAHIYHFILFYFAGNSKISLNQVAKKNSIINQYLENADLSLLSISKKLKLPYSTVKGVILKFQNENTTKSKSGASKKTGPRYPEKAAKVVRAFKRISGLSVREVGQLVGLSSATLGE